MNVFLGILQNFLKLSKKLYFQGAASGVNIWIITIIFTAKIVQTATGISVIFIIRINVLQLHIFFQQEHSVVSVCHCQWQQFFEFGLFHVHWDYHVWLFTEAIDYSHATEKWKFQFPLHVSNKIHMDHSLVYSYSMHPIINLNIDSFNVLS